MDQIREFPLDNEVGSAVVTLHHDRSPKAVRQTHLDLADQAVDPSMLALDAVPAFVSCQAVEFHAQRFFGTELVSGWWFVVEEELRDGRFVR